MEPKNVNFAAMPQTAVNVVANPAGFFREMPRTGGFLEPLVFVVIMGFIAGIIQAILGFLGLGHAGGYGGAMMGSFVVIIFMPIFAAIGSFVGAAILLVIWKLMGSQGNYETAYRCGAYLMALVPITGIIGVVPYAGGLMTMAIYVFYLVAASIHVHNLPSQKAWLVFGVIGVIFALLGIYAEYKARNMGSEMDKWRKMGKDMRKEYRESAKEIEKSSEELQKKAEGMAKQYQREAEEASREAVKNK